MPTFKQQIEITIITQDTVTRVGDSVIWTEKTVKVKNASFEGIFVENRGDFTIIGGKIIDEDGLSNGKILNSYSKLFEGTILYPDGGVGMFKPIDIII